MDIKMEQLIKISVRNLVEFIMRSGDIDNRIVGIAELDAMQEGSRIHRKIQKSMGRSYQAEVPLSITVPVERDGHHLEFCVEGRADGIIEEEDVTIDEIKAIYMDLDYLKEPIGIHLAQAKCYAYIYAKKKSLDKIKVQMTYCNIETEMKKYFVEEYDYKVLEQWFLHLTDEYAKWACWQYEWIQKRNQSVQRTQFPFAYRKGQKELVKGVYRTILRNKNLYIEAPTGVGKTISTVFPTVKAMGEGIVCKIFYLTAKTITRTVAEETFSRLIEEGAELKYVTITAKEKICVMDTCECNPVACERAKGHFDRVNDAVFALLTEQNQITRELILEYSERFCVCPFEMCLDITTWADVVIGDYNYVFDPHVSLKRFFSNEKKNDYVFLIDEAHNLVERARAMYSAVLYKEDILEVRRLVKGYSKTLVKRLDACNLDMLQLKRQCDDCSIVNQTGNFYLHLLRLTSEMEEFLKEFSNFDERETVLLFYFDLRHFMNIYDYIDDNYIVYTDYREDGAFRITLQCMNPSGQIRSCIGKGRSAVFFSATLLPIQYYKEQLGGDSEDYAIYAPSPFSEKQRLLMIGNDVSTKYSRRSDKEYQKIAEYINLFVKEKVGNYFVFFPSYQLMNEIAEYMELSEQKELYIQKNSMTEPEKEEFLSYFKEKPTMTRIGFCVMGGIFGEGIDLKKDRLIGAVIVGTGLPMVCNERELFRSYYQERKQKGFEYAYLYPGMNKVLQAAGRVIRTMEDKGAILLLDSRFLQEEYVALFPREWFPNLLVNKRNICEALKMFWKEEKN
ncbi:ATP-dependent DNA helicase [Velocimicrobium porci]|uniref:ATP-dependent DNA helicase n=1 Tax=Velocimicrobium porci TaxID=2606634 RepID=A0A6L5XV62_9FIRM|nr:ATP-dependent DNA helicase [Velocimicrobium porci]MSS62705.1 ATP-dependent DNA helicase [Velocimicrobium porci]